MTEIFEYVVDEGGFGDRLDVWLTATHPDLTRSRAQQLIKEGHVKIFKKVILKPNRRLFEDEKVILEIPESVPTEVVAQEIPLDILFEDSSMIVINKSHGLVVHPAPGHNDGTIVNALLHHCDDLAGIGGEIRPGIVHRLDKDTSGVMVIAKNEVSLQKLQAQFKARETQKEYIALVRGVPMPIHGRIETMIGRCSTNRKMMSTTPLSGGRTAISDYTLDTKYRDSSLIRVKILTGRTHQVRVHMAHIGTPILGDRLYGRRAMGLRGVPVERQMLHARKLGFVHPVSGEAMEFEAPVPDDFTEWMERLDSGDKKG